MKHKIHLLTGSPIATNDHMHRLLVRLAVRGPVRWLMCGNFVDLQKLFYAIVQSAGSSYADILRKNIIISRAETCHQVSALLHKTEPAKVPTFVTDLLPRFYDEQVHEDEAAALLDGSILALKRLSQAGPVIITAFAGNQRPQFYASLTQNVDRIIRLPEITNMGHTTTSMTMRVRNERDYFTGFCRALLLRSDQLLFDKIWGEVEAYIPAMEKSSHPLLIATILMAMMLDGQKEDAALQCQVEMLKNELKTQHQAHNKELTRMQDAVNRLDADFEERLQRLRSELIEMKFQY